MFSILPDKRADLNALHCNTMIGVWLAVFHVTKHSILIINNKVASLAPLLATLVSTITRLSQLTALLALMATNLILLITNAS